MASPRWKVYDRDGGYQASCKDVAAAACLMGLYGDGATIRDGHNPKDVVWREGAEDFPACESYDRVDAVVTGRADARQEAYLARVGYR